MATEKWSAFFETPAVADSTFIMGLDLAFPLASQNIRVTFETLRKSIRQVNSPVVIVSGNSYTITADDNGAVILCEYLFGAVTTITVNAGSILPPNFKVTIKNNTQRSDSIVRINSATTNTFDFVDRIELANQSSASIALEDTTDVANFSTYTTSGVSKDYRNVLFSPINYLVRSRDNNSFIRTPDAGNAPLVTLPIEATEELEQGFSVSIYGNPTTLNTLTISSENPAVDTVVGKTFSPPGRIINAIKTGTGVNSTWVLDDIYNDKFWCATRTGVVENALFGDLLNSGNISVLGGQLGSRIIKANSLIKGSSIIFDLYGTYHTKAGATGTISFNVKMNGMVVATITPLNPLSSIVAQKWSAKIMCTFRDVGTIAIDNARVLSTGYVNFERIPNVMLVAPVINTGTVGIDTDSDITLEFEVVFSTADPGNQCRLFNGIIYYSY